MTNNIKSEQSKKSRFAFILGEMQDKYPDYKLFHQGEKFTRYNLLKSMRNTFDHQLSIYEDELNAKNKSPSPAKKMNSAKKIGTKVVPNQNKKEESFSSNVKK